MSLHHRILQPIKSIYLKFKGTDSLPIDSFVPSQIYSHVKGNVSVHVLVSIDELHFFFEQAFVNMN